MVQAAVESRMRLTIYYAITLCVIRLFFVTLILRTSFVPDEYYQSVEVAYARVHSLASS